MSEPPLRVGSAFPDPPFDVPGPPRGGLDVELSDALGRRLERPVELCPSAGADFDGIFSELGRSVEGIRSAGDRCGGVIRLVRLSTGADGQSHVEESTLELAPEGRDAATAWLPAGPVRFQSRPPVPPWSGTTHRSASTSSRSPAASSSRPATGETFPLAPGDVLLADDTAGGGHRWRLVDDQPWSRLCVQLPAGETG